VKRRGHFGPVALEAVDATPHYLLTSLHEVSTSYCLNLHLARATLLRATSEIASALLTQSPSTQQHGEEGSKGSGSGTDEAPQGDEGGEGGEVSASPS